MISGKFTEDDFQMWNNTTSVVTLPPRIVGKDKPAVIRNDFISAVGASSADSGIILKWSAPSPFRYERYRFPGHSFTAWICIRVDHTSVRGGGTLPVSKWALSGAIIFLWESNPNQTSGGERLPPYPIWDTHGFHVSAKADSSIRYFCWIPVQGLVSRPANNLFPMWPNRSHAISVSQT